MNKDERETIISVRATIRAYSRLIGVVMTDAMAEEMLYTSEKLTRMLEADEETKAATETVKENAANFQQDPKDEWISILDIRAKGCKLSRSQIRDRLVVAKVERERAPVFRGVNGGVKSWEYRYSVEDIKRKIKDGNLLLQGWCME